MQRGNQNILGAGPEYLGAGLIDVVVDGYFPILETLRRRLEDPGGRGARRAQPGFAAHPLPRTPRPDHAAPRRAMHSALDHLSNHPQYGFSEMTRLSLRDTLDHANQIVDVDASYRDLSCLIDVHLSIQGQKPTRPCGCSP
ncbi:MAG: hypothetical protein R3F17_10520 [Planctomycetota bacterium]